MFRSYNEDDSISKEDLVNNKDFYLDVTKFLEERNGVKEMLTPEEAYDQFMEHMRYHNVNEVTVIRDLEYAQNSNNEGKLRFASLMDAFDKVDEGMSLTGILDYAEGIATAPSTYLGIATGGTGKLASMAGTQGAKLAVRKILGEATKSAAKASAVEGIIGFGQGLGQEAVRTETGLQEKITGDRAITTGLVSAGTAGLINFPIGAIQAKRAGDANEILAQQEFRAAQKAATAKEKSKEVLQEAVLKKPNELAQIRETLEALDPEKVQKGRLIRRMSSTSETLEAGLPIEVVENITASALRIKDEIKIRPKERITSALARMLEEGKFEKLNKVEDILEEHNLNYQTFSYFYLSEISNAGRLLQQQSQVKAALARPKIGADVDESILTYKFGKDTVDGLLSSMDKLKTAGKSAINAEDAKDLIKNKTGGKSFFQDLDRFRLGVMTSQPATTMRNNLNGGLRTALDATTRVFDNLLNLRNPFDGTFDVAKHALSPYEAIVIQKLFKQAFPEEGSRLFREAADLEAVYGKEGPLAVLGRKVNVLNTMSDNIWKRAVLATSLTRRISDKKIGVTDDMRLQLLKNKMSREMDRTEVDSSIAKAQEEGTLNTLLKGYKLDTKTKKKLHFHDLVELDKIGDIDDNIIKESIKDAYDFVYQTQFEGKNFFGKIAKGTIKAHQDMPFIISSFMPFPRFVASQIKFLHQHAPLIGMLPLDKPIDDIPLNQYIKEKLPKQMSGAMFLIAAYNWRLKQGDTTNWYEFKDNNDNVIDGRPVYGPFSSFILAADIMIRYQNGSLPATISPYVRDALQATLGSTFRAGMGLYTLDKAYTDLEDGRFGKSIAETIGNIFNTFTLPASAIRDVIGQFNEDMRGIPETRTGDMNFWDVLYARGTRSLPKNYAGEFSERARSPFETGELKPINPLEKQIFGLTKRKPKSLLLEEMAKVGLRPFDLYRRDKNEKRDLYIRDVLSEEGGDFNLNTQLESLINSDRYKNLGDDADARAIKRDMLDAGAEDIIKVARELADQRIEVEAFDARASYTTIDKTSWQRVPAIDKARIDAEYRRQFGGDSVSADRDKTVVIDDIPINVLRWGLERYREIRGTKGTD
jgi:hypothetical protein